MNANTLNRLMAERIMGWHFEHGQCWIAPDGKYMYGPGWEPTVNANQALAALDKVSKAVGGKWQLTNSHKADGTYFCYMAASNPGRGEAETAALAICLCALKAAGVTDEELNA